MNFVNSNFAKWAIGIAIFSTPFVFLYENRKNGKFIEGYVEKNSQKLASEIFEKMDKNNKIVEYILKSVELEKLKNLSNEIYLFISKENDKISKFENEKQEVAISGEMNFVLFSSQVNFHRKLIDDIARFGLNCLDVPSVVQPKFKFYLTNPLPEGAYRTIHRNERYGIDPQENRAQFAEWHQMMSNFARFKDRFDEKVAELQRSLIADREKYGF